MKSISNKINLILLSVFTIFILSGCTIEVPLGDQASIVLPKGFEVIEHDTKYDEILALNYKGEMRVAISENMSKIIKKSSLFGGGAMKQSFDIKYIALQSRYKGTNSTKQAHHIINENLYIYQSFDYDIDDTAGYYEYGALYIADPEDYFEFYITGDRTKHEAHKKAIRALVEGVR